MRVHSGHGFNPHVPAMAVPQPVRFPDDHLEGGKQAYSLRGSVRQDVAQVDESVVQNLVAGCRADRVASSSRFARRKRKRGRRLGQFSEHGVELVRAELARDQLHLSQVRQIQDADRVDEIENERVCSHPGPIRTRQLVRYLREGLIVPFDDPLPFALQAVPTVCFLGWLA